MNKSIGFYALRYAAFYLAIAAILVGVATALDAVAPELADMIFGGGNSFLVVVTVILPTVLVAQSFFKHEHRQMRRGEGWTLALIVTILAIGLGVAMFLMATVLQPGHPAGADLRFSTVTLLGVVAVFGAALVLLNRFALWSTLRNEMKKEEKQAIKRASKG